ncbi:hypothetical protein AAFN86_27910 [Roseomonas sp. CAU 1739]|uniref:hypothetical protein n=1 Tax=Roseomonas sp. CAU 1739 TaxID=3140364 RepID=UPI00325A88FC
MSIRRDLLLRSALLRQPDMPPLPPLRAVTQPPAPPPRRTSKATPRRRTTRVSDSQGSSH